MADLIQVRVTAVDLSNVSEADVYDALERCLQRCEFDSGDGGKPHLRVDFVSNVGTDDQDAAVWADHL